MKHIYTLLIMIVIAFSAFGQDTLKTEIVINTESQTPIKIYKLSNEKIIFYGENNYGMEQNSTSTYPYKGTSYEREFLSFAPTTLSVPQNREVSFVVVDEKASVNMRFTTITGERKQVWNIIPAGLNYNKGRRNVLLGIAGLVTSGILFGVAIYQNEAYKMDRNHYVSTVKMHSTFPTGSSLPDPVKPNDRRMGFTIPVLTTSVSLVSIIAGSRMVLKNSPKIYRIE